MLRRSISELSSRGSFRKIQRQITTPRLPVFTSSSKEFSTASRKPEPLGKSKEPADTSFKLLLGSAVVTGAIAVAYHGGYFDQYLGKGLQKSGESAKVDELNKVDNGHSLEEHIDSSNVKQNDGLSSPSEEHKVETQVGVPSSVASSETPEVHGVENDSDVNSEEGTVPSSKSEETLQGSTTDTGAKNLPQYSTSRLASNDQSTHSDTSLESSKAAKIVSPEISTEVTEEVAIKPQTSPAHQENQTNVQTFEQAAGEETPKDVAIKAIDKPNALLNEYYIKESADLSSVLSDVEKQFSAEALVSTIEELNDSYITKDGKLVLNFLGAIHAAEKRQAELDAHVFGQELRALKERYENELRDSRARELMRIEEAAILDKEINRERAKAAATINSIQEKMGEKLRTELEQKEAEAHMKLETVQELAKAELAAAIATEKAAQIEKMAEANLHINALCMAFYARSEEARKSHSVHKLALGALALEDALSKGLPIQKEIDVLQTYLEGDQKDTILSLVLSSLPEETRSHGTETSLQLSEKFKTLKSTLQHFSLIPPGGGGILTHLLAQIASGIKIKEVDQSGDGIESVLKRVDSYLAEGKLAEAAAALEEGVKGSKAEEIVGDWVCQARNRAITEQALTLLQSYATCISLT